MKKTILLLALFVSAFSITSCSDDDSTNVDLLIGKWKIVQEFENDEELELGCSSEGILEFKSDFTYTAEDYEEDANDNCILEETITGAWLKNSNGSYTVTSSEGFSTTVDLVFEDDNTFVFTDVDGSFTYKTVYKRQ